MNRRQFLQRAGFASLAALGLTGWSQWPQGGVVNPCKAGLPPSLARHELMAAVWEGLDPAQVWDCHAHLVGVGDGGSGAWTNPRMDSPLSPLQYLQKLFYLNAGCVHNAPGQVDASFVARLDNLLDGFPAGAKIMLFAFDWAYDENGQRMTADSAFHIPDAYAARVARANPARIEWVASVHPYREDALEALANAVKSGARALKWLPAAMGIDPDSPRCDRFYRALVQHDLPLITHAGHEMAVAGKARQDYGNPLKLRRALEHGVRVVVAHCASHGEDRDLDAGKLYADISAVTQFNRADVLETLLSRRDWHSRLLNGSDYPLPGILPLISPQRLAAAGLLPQAAPPFLLELREHNPLLFDFAVKRLLRKNGVAFPRQVFETRPFFERKLP